MVFQRHLIIEKPDYISRGDYWDLINQIGWDTKSINYKTIGKWFYIAERKTHSSL